MPTYEYKCDACGFKFEKFQSIKSTPTKKCPHCGKNRAKRLIGTGAGLIFKGSGFYITDYRSEAYKSAAKTDSGSSAPAKESKDSPAGGSTDSGDGKSKAAGDVKASGDTKAATPAKSESKPAASAPAKESKGGKREKGS